jgi:hypothetical protein
MEPLVASLRGDASISFRSVMTAWLPSLEARGVDSVKTEWAEAVARTGARIDPTYWDRVAAKTSLIAGAAVKAAQFQGEAKGEAYLSALRRAAFERGDNVASFEVLTGLAEPTSLKADVFRDDLGVGRYGAQDIVKALNPAQPLSESVWWFGRRKMLRSWDALSSDLRAAEKQGLTSPAFHILHGDRQTVLRGFASEPQVRSAMQSVR